MSSPSVKPDIGSKVLPGDKTGLPWEIWRIILSCLTAEDLCRSACVCKTWNDLVMSLDSSRWKELYLQCGDWRHPYWPLNTDSEPASWRLAYREQYMSSRFWTRCSREPEQATCLYVLKRRKDRKVIRVGQGMEHSSLKSALAIANDYDRIEIYPGIYDEQFEMSSKIPFEIIGVGELGSIILVVCIEQIALTGRVSNLVFRAPWFTNFILKVRTGYLQVDNCILEDGMMYVQNPGSCHVKFCTFRHATIILQHLNSSIIENCEFSQADSAAITVEGNPREDRNWTYGYMLEKISNVNSLQRLQQNKGYETAPTSAYSTSTGLTYKKMLEKCDVSKTDSVSGLEFGCVGHSAHTSLMNTDISHQAAIHNSLLQNFHSMDMNQSVKSNESVFCSTHDKSVLTYDKSVSTTSSCSTTEGNTKVQMSTSGDQTSAIVSVTNSDEKGIVKSNKKEKNCISQNSSEKLQPVSAVRRFSESNVSASNYSHESFVSSMSDPPASTSKSTHNCISKYRTDEEHLDSPTTRDTDTPSNIDLPKDVKNPIQDDARSRSHSRSSHRSSRTNSPISTVSGSDFFEDEDSIGDFDSGSAHSSHRGSSSSSSEEVLSDTESDFSDEEESVIMLTCPEHQLPRSVSSLSIGADVQSICSQNQSEHIRIVHDTSMQKILDEVRGCLIYCCRMTQCKGAVMVSLQAHALISQCDINSVGYGIRCIQNARVILLKNEIHHCRTSGIFMRLAASGLIAGNDIHSNCEAGIDIRKNADPCVISNRIHHGKRSGIVVLGSGRGQIKNNEIYQNKEAGVYILYRGNPVVCKNQIHSGKAAGVAVNEGGRGYVQDNTISGNQWGGVDIRHGGDPVITQNIICNGLSDGIVIGKRGKGSIENNVISGNAGCGVWITAACQPMIHGNQINGNGDTGITFVNKSDELHEADTMGVEHSEIHSQRSLDFWQMINDEQPMPRRTCTRATVEYNSIYHNNGRGVIVKFGDEVALQCNAIHGNRGDGIHVDQELCVLVKDNSVTCNSGDGINVSMQGQVQIEGNGIFDNRDHGIFARNKTSLIHNDIAGNQRCAVKLEGNSTIELKENRLQSHNEKAMTLLSVHAGTVTDNQVYSSGSSQTIYSSPDSACALSHNEFIVMETKPTLHSVDQTKTSKSTGLLKNPRPRIQAPPIIPTLPANRVSTITRVAVPSTGTCEEGSKLCTIL